MTISTTINRVNYTADGVIKQFSFSFKANDVSHILAYFDAVAQGSGFTVTLNANQETTPGGTVDFTVAPTAAVIVTVARSLPLTQQVDYPEYDPFPAATHETALDELVMKVQQLDDALDRAVIAPVTDDGTVDYTLPAAEALKTFRWNAAGTALENTDDPAVSAAAALVSETNAAASESNAAANAVLTAADVVLTNADVVSAGDSAAAALVSENNASDSAALAANQNLYNQSLVKLTHPDESKGLQELQSQGIYPSSFNQQWGGMGYGGLPDGTLGEVATGCILFQTGNLGGIASSTGEVYRSQGFILPQNTDLASAWVYIRKIGTPANNLQLAIYSDSSGSPNAVITNGAAIAQSGKLHSDNSEGGWVKFTFATNPSLVAGTQYHIVCNSSGAVDTSNYWQWFYDSSGSYPHGFVNNADSTPTWSQATGIHHAFIIEPVTNVLQSGLSGFDGALACYEGATLDQSGAFYFSNSELNHKRGTILLSGTGWDKDKTFYDSGLSADENRIVLRCNVSTGYAQVDLYENDGTKLTVTGTTDISTGNHTVGVRYRSEGDGADVLYLYVDGASEGTALTAQTITLDRAFEDGHTTLGGGFPLAPSWTKDLDMTVLPSAVSGWTYGGTGAESGYFSSSNGIMYQGIQAGGFSATDTGFYQETTALNNSGWAVAWKNKVVKTSGATGSDECAVDVRDGSRIIRTWQHKYFIEINDATNSWFVQHDCTKATDYILSGSGDNFYLYADGKLIFDGTGLLVGTSTSNFVRMGDVSTASGATATVQWSYFKYYLGAHLPEYSTMKLSEHCNWNDDKSSLLSTIYNSGSIQSVKTLAGMNQNYVNKVKQVISVKGVISSPTTTSTNAVPLEEMDIFCFNSKLAIDSSAFAANSLTNGFNYHTINIDGAAEEVTGSQAYAAGANTSVSLSITKEKPQMLHYIQITKHVSANTRTENGKLRTLAVEAE